MEWVLIRYGKEDLISKFKVLDQFCNSQQKRIDLKLEIKILYNELKVKLFQFAKG